MNLTKIIKEEIQSFLFEATALEIWNGHYKKIPKDVFYKIIDADPTTNLDNDKMGKFSKWLLGLYKRGELKLEDLYKAKDYLREFIKYRNILEIKDINKYTSLPQLFKAIQNIKTEIKSDATILTKQKAAKFIKNGDAEIYYEDSDWLVIIPKTMEASQYFGLNTQWCTASDDEERNVFDTYHLQNGRHYLYIFINKHDNKDKYQLYLGDWTQFKDRYDDEADVDRVIDEDLFKEILKREKINYKHLNLDTNIDNLIEIIEEFYCEGYSRDGIDKKTIIEFLDGTYYPDMWYPELDTDTIAYYIEEKHVEKIFKKLIIDGVDIKNEIYKDDYIKDLDGKDLLDYLESEHEDIYLDIKGVYFSASGTTYYNDFYEAIVREINNFDLNEYSYNLHRLGLSTREGGNDDCIIVYEPQYGFDSSPEQSVFDERFNEEF
jgi:hypothetical protein